MTEGNSAYCVDLNSALKIWIRDQVERGRLTSAAENQILNNTSWLRDCSHYPSENELRSLGTQLAKFSVDLANWVKDNVAISLDMKFISKIWSDLGGSLGKVRYSTYNGKLYIIFKGNQKARKLIVGTRYLVNNPKLIALGVGQAGAKKFLKGGAVFSVVIVSAVNIINFILHDEMTFKEFAGTLAMDLLKVGIAYAAGVGIVAAVGGLAAVSTLAIGSLVAAACVSTLAGFALDYADDHFKLTEKFIALLDETTLALDEIQFEIDDYIQNVTDDVYDKAGKTIDYLLASLIGATQERAIRTAKKVICGNTFICSY